MTQEINIANNLADLLQTHNFDVETTDDRGQVCQPEDAKIFKFDFVAPSGKNYGTAVITLSDDRELILFFGDNLGKSIENPEDKNAWFDFMHELKNFSVRNNFNNFSPKNINQLKHTLRGMAAIKEGLFESYYGNRKVSYMGEPTEARLLIKHNRMIGENDKRYRYVESLFVETVDGERFKLPFKHLGGGRAMLEHVRQGGKPYDIRGMHITEIINEMAVLARFNRASHQRMFEGVTKELVESATNYYQQLKENIKHLESSRGYKKYFESWSPVDVNAETALVEDLRTMFIEQTLDSRIEAALPTLAKIQQQGSNMKEANIFEAWANNLLEGTWALPDTPEANAKLKELMSKELIVGPDATNATEQLYDIIGDDQLFDILQDLAKRDPRANCWDDTDVQGRLAELGIQTPESTAAEPADVAQDTAPEEPVPQQTVAESVLTDSTGNTWDHLLDRFRHEVKQFRQGDELDNNLYDALFDYYSQHGAMPYGVAKARTGDPYNWVSQRFADDLGLSEADPTHQFEGSCNMTAEGEYCPEHGLAECGGMYETGTVAGSVAPVMGEGQGDFEKALGTLSGSYSGWYPDETQSDPGVKAYWYDDGEGGFYADGKIEHNLRTGEITVSFVDKDGYHGGDVKGTFPNMGAAMRALRGGGGNHGGRAPNFDRLAQRTQHGPDDLRKTDRTGRKGTVGGGFTNARKASIQHSLGKHGPKGVLPETDDAINYNAAITGSYYESKDDPLARIKSLALSK